MSISLSTNTLNQGSIMRYPFQQASIYTDACFILSLMDPRDPHHGFSKNLLLLWAHSGVTMCYSNHVQHEVTHALLRMSILEALDMYESLGFPTTTTSLTPEQNRSLVDLPLVAILHSEALSFTHSRGSNLPRNRRRLIKLIIPHFIKHLKRNGISITPFFDKANSIFDRFITRVTFSIQPWYNLATHCLTSDYSMGLNAIELAKNFELDSTDAVHLSVAFHNNCDYFVTKDNDLSSINVNGLAQHQKLVRASTGTTGVGMAQSLVRVSGTILYMP